MFLVVKNWKRKVCLNRKMDNFFSVDTYFFPAYDESVSRKACTFFR